MSKVNVTDNEAIEEVAARMDIYKIQVALGEKDGAGRTITKIFGQKLGQYIVFESNSQVRISGDQAAFEKCATIVPLIARISSLSASLPHLSDETNAFKGKALIHACAGEVEAANAILTDLFDKIVRIKNTRARLQYLFGSFMLTILVLIISGIVLYRAMPASGFNSSMESLNIKNINILYQCILAITMSTMGGFLSVLLNLNKLAVDNESGFSVNAFAGTSRILIAIIAGITTLVFIKADILFGFINKNQSIFGLLSLCLLSGFSESIIPNALKKLESSSMSSKK